MPDWTTRSFWLEHRPYEPGPSLEGDARCDVAIVGGGFTGLWTAILLKEAEPSLDVTVLEQKVVGYGASGRNGGFAMTMVGRNLHDLVRKVGPGRAKATHLAMVDAVQAIERFAAAEGIEADVWPSGNLTISNGPEQDVRIHQDVEAAARLGLDDFELLDRDAVRERVQSERIRMGHFEKHCLILDPAALARGLRDAARRRGVRILEHTPVDAVVPVGGTRVECRCPRGTVHADRVLIATNAYAHALPALRRFIFTIYANITLSEPLTPAQWERVGWQSRCGVEDKRVMLHFHRPTADGRILWGGRDAPFVASGPNPRHDRDPRIAARLEETFRWTFPQLADVRMDRAWAGPVCGTVECIASVRWLRGERILYALGYAGHGVGPSRLAAAIARDLLLGDTTSDLVELPLHRRRPIPLPPGRTLRRLVLDAAHDVLIRMDDDPSRAERPLGKLALKLLQ